MPKLVNIAIFIFYCCQYIADRSNSKGENSREEFNNMMKKSDF